MFRATKYLLPTLVAAALCACTIDGVEMLERELPGIVGGPGPAFAVLRVEPESDFPGTPPITYEGAQMKYRFGRALERRLGVTVLGPQGY